METVTVDEDSVSTHTAADVSSTWRISGPSRSGVSVTVSGAP